MAAADIFGSRCGKRPNAFLPPPALSFLPPFSVTFPAPGTRPPVFVEKPCRYGLAHALSFNVHANAEARQRS